MRNHVPRKPSAIVLLFGLALVIQTFGANRALADPITDFDGMEVFLTVDVTANGGQSFFVDLIGSNTATIGAGYEYTLNVGASGFSARPVRIDFDNEGLVNAYADSQFAIGNTRFSDFSFDVSFSLVDAEIISAVSSGDLIRGDATASGLDPVVWTFVNESDNSFGKIMTFGPEQGTTPKVQLSAMAVPEPSSVALIGLMSTVLLCKRRRKLR